jgi:hypothetical protein
MPDGPVGNAPPVATFSNGRDSGARLIDVDSDGICEILVANPDDRFVAVYDRSKQAWLRTSAVVPEPIVDGEGRDAGLRFVDLNTDGRDDIVFSNDQRYSVHLFESPETGWSRPVRAGGRGDADAIPMIVRAGTNNGAWFAEGHMWLQNEDTHRLPDGVDRRTFAEVLGRQ